MSTPFLIESFEEYLETVRKELPSQNSTSGSEAVLILVVKLWFFTALPANECADHRTQA